MASKLTRPLFSDGQGLDYGDLNDLAELLRQHATAGALYSLGRGGAGEREATALNGVLWLHAIGDSCAPAASATNLKVDVLGGIVMQSTDYANPTGIASGTDLGSVLAYAAYSGELSTVHDAGDVSHDRWDLVSVQLAQADGDSATRDFEDATTRVITSQTLNTRRNVTITKTVTKGTPAASPTIPATPAGQVRLYAVRVPTGATGVLAAADLRDFRLPTGRFTVDVFACEELARGAVNTGSSWTSGNGAYGYVQSGANTDAMYFVPRGPLGHGARLVSVQVLTGESSSATFDVRRFNAAETTTSLDDLSLSLQQSAGAGNLYMNSVMVFSAAPSTTNPASCGVWSNGWPAGYANRVESLSGSNKLDKVGLYFLSGATSARIAMVRFNFAGGL